MAQTSSNRRGLSIWPFILIGAGVIWLLAEAGIITGANLSVLFRLWPVILIAIGVELLVGRSSQALSTLIGVLTVVLLIGLMVVGPSLGLATNADVQEDSFSAPLEGAQSARIEIQANTGSVQITPATDTSDLFAADIRYIGEVNFETRDNDGQRIVSLTNDDDTRLEWFNFLAFVGEDQLTWDVRLSDAVPTDLTVNTGTGGVDLDLSTLQLTALNINSGTGGVNVDMPEQAATYNAVVNTGTGGIDIRIPEGAAVALRISSGTGGVDIDVPDNAAVRLVGSVSTGGIDVPSWLQRVGGDDERNFIGADGVWQTAGFDDAEQQIIINFSGGTGGLDVR